jgi:SDR family mycofactocin-dependent oxidoreductase
MLRREDEGVGKLDGKVAFITGAARGQGRSHAVRLAEEGADILAVDICSQIPTVTAPMAGPADMEETVSLVEGLGRRIYSSQADVRSLDELSTAFSAGVTALGHVDIVVANAAIAPLHGPEPDKAKTVRDIIDVNLIGALNTVFVSAPAMVERGQGGAIILIGSTQSLHGRGGDASVAAAAYTASKHGVIGLMKSVGYWLGPHSIRVNTICPAGVATPMMQNEVVSAWIAANPELSSNLGHLMPGGLIDSADISNAVVYLASDDGRFVTGIALPVDAGYLLM